MHRQFPTLHPMSTSHILTLSCPDRPGIVHAVCTGLLDVGGNIVENSQFGEPETSTFCMRTVFTADESDPLAVRDAIAARLSDAQATIEVRREKDRPRVLIMVSKFDHCLVDILYRWRNGGLAIEIPLIVSNHPDCREVAEAHGIRFVHLPVSTDTKSAQEAELLRLIDAERIDLVVLARYMQILSDQLCRRLEGRAINIHHSFLPGFKGAKPYHQAYERGVKLVGATAHFVTGDLDEGPIIEQGVARVNHAHTVQELVSLGQDTERLVLSRAVKLWAEDRILLVGARTIVFD